jgi:intron-binding protein aquarius
MQDEIAVMDFNDTFLDADHLRSSFPGYECKMTTTDPKKLVRPFRLTFEDVISKQNNEEERKVIIVEPHVPLSRGPYKANEPKK